MLAETLNQPCHSTGIELLDQLVKSYFVLHPQVQTVRKVQGRAAGLPVSPRSASHPMLSYVLNNNGTAVDFPAHQRDGHREMIRLCANLTNPLTRQRELPALTKFDRSMPTGNRKPCAARRPVAGW
jgi:hypothetical protein